MLSESACVQRGTIYVGSKPIIAYVVAAMMELAKGREVTIKARGKSISRAVDTVQVIRNRYLSMLRIKRITFSSEPRPDTGDGSGESYVSCVEIVVSSA